jgi:Zn-dependent protease with chaperone function
MNFGLLLVGLALLSFPALVGPRSGRLPPAEWARVATTALALGAVCVYAGLIATTLPPVLHMLQLEGLFGICDPVVHSLMIGGPPVGWAAAVLAALITMSGIQALRRNRRATRVARIEPWLGTHSERAGYDLVVIPTPALVAMGVPGDVPQIIVSEGLVSELDDARLQAVVEHEAAHLRLQHHRYLAVVAIVEKALRMAPFVRRSALAIRQSLEVWADDRAVATARASEQTLHSALLTVATSTFSPSDEYSVGHVMTRARRLIHPAPCLSATVRGLTYLPAGGLLCGAAVLAIGWVLSSHQMLSLGGYC